jgi:hypothetical protein
MVRRSTLDRSPQPDLYSAGYDPEAGNQQAGTGKRPPSGPGWRGAGGRWLVWTFRVVVWAVWLIIGYCGAMAIVLNETPPTDSPSDPAAPEARGFPAQEASAYALQFGQVYLNASPAVVDQRASQRRRGPPDKDGLVRQHETASVKRAEVPGQGRLRP